MAGLIPLHVPLIYVKGELDHDSVSQLRPVIDDELHESPDVLLLDLSELGYMDSGGSVAPCSRWCGDGASPLDRDGRPQPGCRALLQMTGLADSPSVRIFPRPGRPLEHPFTH